MFRSNNSSHGWNAVFGQSYGAYYPRQCPGGSSGGSAVASDLGLAWATLGTEVCNRWGESLLIPRLRWDEILTYVLTFSCLDIR